MSSVAQLSNLERFKKLGGNRYIACCPAHDDRNPSLSITQGKDKLLVHCFAGCSQAEVIDALVALGLWHKKSNTSSIPYSSDELSYMRFFCLAWNGSVRNKRNVARDDTTQMEAYLRVLAAYAHDFYLDVVEDATNGL